MPGWRAGEGKVMQRHLPVSNAGQQWPHCSWWMRRWGRWSHFWPLWCLWLGAIWWIFWPWGTGTPSFPLSCSMTSLVSQQMPSTCCPRPLCLIVLASVSDFPLQYVSSPTVCWGIFYGQFWALQVQYIMDTSFYTLVKVFHCTNYKQHFSFVCMYVWML